MKIDRLLATCVVAFALSGCGKDETAAPAAAETPSATAPAAAPAMPALPATPVPPPPRVDARGYVIMDFMSGQILAASNENERLEPASLTKLMTAYVVFDALRAGKLQLEDTAIISENAWRIGGAGSDGSTSFMPLGSQVPVEVLLRGMIIQSGNDASIALAERVGGTEETFAQLMNEYAKRLGMSGSSFGNATGLPSPLDYTTARDMAVLAAALVRDFPQYYHYFAEKEYTYNGITQRNRNGLLLSDPTVDGLKTGHTEAAGYCLVTSAKRNDMRLVTTVMGTPSIKARESATSALLNYGFSFYETRRFYGAGEKLANVRVWKGETEQVDLGPNAELLLTLPRGRAADVQVQLEVPMSVEAPLARNVEVGKVNLMLDGTPLASRPVYPLQDVASAGFFGRMSDTVKMWFE